MTNETKPGAVDRYLIRKGGYYYRPNAQGYTGNNAEAGRYTLEEAISYSHPNGPNGPRDGISYELDTTAQSQPAATVQEVRWHGERPEQVCEAIAQFWSEWEEDRAGSGVYSQEELAETAGEFATDLFDRLAALTAGPAATAGDAEPVAWACYERSMGEWRKRYVDEKPTGERYRDIVPLYAAPPSPQPDMGRARVIMSSVRLGKWMSAALDDPNVCEEMKTDIRDWFSAGEPVVGWTAALSPPVSQSVEKMREAFVAGWQSALSEFKPDEQEAWLNGWKAAWEAHEPVFGNDLKPAAAPLDWLKVAKLAGEHGIRYRTNRALEQFLAALSPSVEPTATSQTVKTREDALRRSGQFLLDRIDQLEWSNDGYDDLVRDWMGHVDPALDRFRAALSTLPHKEEATPAPVGEQGADIVEAAKELIQWRKPHIDELTNTAGSRRALAKLIDTLSTPATTERGRG